MKKTDFTFSQVTEEIFANRVACEIFTAAPFAEFAVVAVDLTPEGYFDLTGWEHDPRHIPPIVQTIAASGLPSEKRVEFTPYNLKYRMDIFDRIEPVDGLIICNLQPSLGDRKPTPEEYRSSLERWTTSEEHWWARSIKSYDTNAWHDLAERLKVKFIATYGMAATIDGSHFRVYTDTNGERQVSENYLRVPEPERQYETHSGARFLTKESIPYFDLLLSRNYVASIAASYPSGTSLPNVDTANVINRAVLSYIDEQRTKCSGLKIAHL